MAKNTVKKKRVTLARRLEKAASDIADAVSVAATGSQIGVLELAAEDELDVRPVKRAKKKVAAKKKAPARKVAVKKKAAPKKVAKKAAKKAKSKRR